MFFLIFRIFGGKSFFVTQTVLCNVNFVLNLINISDKTLPFALQERDHRNLGKDRKRQKWFSLYATRLSKTKKNQEKLIKTGWVQIKTCFSLFAFVFLCF